MNRSCHTRRDGRRVIVRTLTVLVTLSLSAGVALPRSGAADGPPEPPPNRTLQATPISADPPSSALPSVADDPLVRPIDFDRQRPSEQARRDIRATIEAEGVATIVVTLRTMVMPPGLITADEDATQRQRFAELRDALLTEAGLNREQVVRAYESLPALAITVDDRSLERVFRSDLVASITPNALTAPQLDETAALVGATETHALLDVHGEGRAIAVIDTGVEAAHPFFGGRVLEGACFSHRVHFELGLLRLGDCPGGQSTATGTGAAEPCTFSTRCAHGTHVAGIAGGAPFAARKETGIAPATAILPLQVSQRSDRCPAGVPAPCPSLADVDVIAALDHVLNREVIRRVLPLLSLGLPPVAAVNMSIGRGVFDTACDAESPAMAAAISNLRSFGIPTIISTGNQGRTQGIAFPACVSTAVRVGATTNADEVANLSNSHALVTLLAPGVDVMSSLPGAAAATMGSDSGTSMAAPHVAGALSLLRQLRSTASVATLVNVLTSTGRPVTDQRNNLTRPRIRILDAVGSLMPLPVQMTEVYRLSSSKVAVRSTGAGLRTGNATLTLPSAPAGHVARKAFLYWRTSNGQTERILFNGNPIAPSLVRAISQPPTVVERLYRADVTHLLLLTGNTYQLSVTTLAPAIALGASLVVAYDGNPAANPTLSGSVEVAVIADTLVSLHAPFEWTPFTFRALPTNKLIKRIGLHVGVSNGDSAPEGAVELGTEASFVGAAVTPPNPFSATSGPSWDDLTIDAPPSLLPPSAAAARVTLRRPLNGGDEFELSYLALEYATAARTGLTLPQN